jgi:hypothetical protein
LGPIRRQWLAIKPEDRFWQILLQKSKAALARIFGETLKREAIDDSDNLSLYTKTASAALRIFDTFGKTTFATLSALLRHADRCCRCLFVGEDRK